MSVSVGEKSGKEREEEKVVIGRRKEARSVAVLGGFLPFLKKVKLIER